MIGSKYRVEKSLIKPDDKILLGLAIDREKVIYFRKLLENCNELPPIKVEQRAYGKVLDNGHHRLAAHRELNMDCPAEIYIRTE